MLDAHLEKWTLIASLATAEQAVLAAQFRKDKEGNGLRKVNYNTIEPDFVDTEVEHTALFNGLKQHAPEVGEETPVQELRAIRERLLAIPVE